MGRSNIETSVQDDYWTNSRAKSLDSRNILNTTRRPKYSPQDDRTIPRTMVVPLFTQKPPPPSVEDEYDALAKEAGSIVSSVPSEEPSNRGDPDQYPILMPVHDESNEENSERRFILLSNPSDSSVDPPHETKTSQYHTSAERSTETDPDLASYEANTGRKYGSPPSSEDKTSTKKEEKPEREHRRSRAEDHSPITQPEREHRRSGVEDLPSITEPEREHRRDRVEDRPPATQPEREHHRGRLEDLPPIITNDDERRTYETRRAKSTTRAESRRDEYLSPRVTSASSRYPRENMMSPEEVIEYGTNGRERSYYRSGRSKSRVRNRSAHPSDTYGSSRVDDRRSKDTSSKSTRSPTPEMHKRNKSENPKYSRCGLRDNHDSFRLFVDAPSSAYPQSDRDSRSRNSSTVREKRAPQYIDSACYNDDEPRLCTDYYRRSAMLAGRTEYLDKSIDSRGKGRRKTRDPSPLSSPRASQYSLADAYPSHSRSRGATSPKEPRSPVRSERSSSRAPIFAAPKNVNPLMGASATAVGSVSNPSLSIDPRRSIVPPLPRASFIADSRVRPPTPSSTVPTQSIWPPPQLKTTTTSAKSNQLIDSYRRYSTDAKNGEVSSIPHCPRTREEVGHMDWLMLPHCDNFAICPSCYNANFAATEFAREFVPMPFRTRDRPQACDFGASEYYRLAWLLTKKYGRTDLGLFYDLAEIAAQGQQCVGSRRISRIWYSIMDPRTRRPVEEFTVCISCAQTVEALLPSLTGIFVSHEDPVEISRSVCAMHQNGKRFPFYFDMLEDAADRTLETQSPPDMQTLTDRVGQLAAIRPCAEANVLHNAYWHTMRSVPEFVVCPECFATVVRPLLESDEDLTIVGNFHHVPTRLPEGQCMLFSDRMRDVFDRAVRKRDLTYLDVKIGERLDKQHDCNVRLEALRRQGLETPWVKAETGRILQEWRRYE